MVGRSSLPADSSTRYARTVIVVVGSPIHRPSSSERPPAATGLAVRIATAATAAGGTVQLVGRVGQDPAGDATLLAVAAAGIGHVATLRDAARPTSVEPAPVEPDPDLPADVVADEDRDPADDRSSLRAGDPATLDADDVELALRYLDGYRVIVVAEPLSQRGLEVAAEAAAYGGAQLVAIVAVGGKGAGGVPDGAIVIEAPETDPDGVFALTVGTLAAALDQGLDPTAALSAAVASASWERSSH